MTRMFGILLLVTCAALHGCAGMKAGDSTKLGDYATRGETQVTYTVLPGAIAGMPDHALAIPTVPGKDVVFESHYPDGQLQWRLETRRSAVLDALLGSGGISSLDAAKFAADAEAREWLSRERAAWVALLGPALQARLAPPPPADSAPGWRDLLKDQEFIRALRESLKP